MIVSDFQGHMKIEFCNIVESNESCAYTADFQVFVQICRSKKSALCSAIAELYAVKLYYCRPTVVFNGTALIAPTC